jgi:hypothetical protein
MMGMDASATLLAHSLWPVENERVRCPVQINPQCVDIDFGGEFDDVLEGPWFNAPDTYYRDWVSWYRSWQIDTKRRRNKRCFATI